MLDLSFTARNVLLGASLLGIPRLSRWLGKVRPAWLHVHMRHAGTLGRLAAVLQDIPTVVALHNQVPPPPAWLGPLEGWLDRRSRFSRCADRD